AFGLLTNCAPDYVSELHQFFSEVYPNPSSDKVHFRLMRKENKFDLFVFSSDGKLVRKINSMTPTNELIVDGLNPGIYFYRINKEESVASGKFVLIN
ncbi:MAG TPA: T9SS type A sorting domain-containing protein, partial [Bacteroidia bacterium]|nr:T9SS type A sorting domain-containing protein [Bacteroidia bacterium]